MIVSYDSIITMPPRSARPSRADVLEAAERLLVIEGPDALSMRRLATELGTSYQVVYTRIGGKADVVRALHVASGGSSVLRSMRPTVLAHSSATGGDGGRLGGAAEISTANASAVRIL